MSKQKPYYGIHGLLREAECSCCHKWTWQRKCQWMYFRVGWRCLRCGYVFDAEEMIDRNRRYMNNEV